MRNLAGASNAGRYIRNELEAAGIPVVRAPLLDREVRTRLEGRLGDFTFERAWTYWVVKGPMPLDLAIALDMLYGNSCAIRAAGFAGGPRYHEWGRLRLVTWRTPDGSNGKPGLAGARAFIESFHIDNEEALRGFVNFLRENNLA